MEKRKKRNDGYFKVSFTYEGRRYYCYGATQKEAREKAELKRQELKQGITSQDMTLDAYFDLWYEGREGTVTAATQRSVKMRFRPISKYIGGMKIKSITAATVRKLQKQLKLETDQKGRKRFQTSGINIRITLLSTICKSAVHDRLLVFNPCESVKGLKRTEPRMRNTVHRALTEAELTLFFQYATSSYYCNLMRLLAATGARCGEAAALRWSDIDRKANVIHIRRTVERINNNDMIISDQPKNESSRRDIPLTPAAILALENQRKQNEMLSGSKITRFDGLIFTTPAGKLIDSCNVNSAISCACARIRKDGYSLDRFSPHAFRDTFATLCVNQGMKPTTLQRILGHANLSMTMDLYYHIHESQKQEEMQKIVIPV